MNSIPDDKMIDQPPLPFSAGDGWNSTDAPNDGDEVEVYSRDRHGFYVLPFVVIFSNDRWWNANTGDELAVYVEGWRERKEK